MFKQWIHKIKAQYYLNESMCNEVTLVNINRLFMIAVVAIPIHLIQIILFLVKQTNTASEAIWRMGIIYAHASLMMVMLIIGVIGYLIKYKAKKFESHYKFILLMLMFTIFSYGILITAIDQLVTTNITPFFVASLVVGLVFYLRPLYALIMYLFFSLSFFFTLNFVIVDSTIRLTNQVNGLTVSGLGLFLSLNLWQGKVKNIIQHQTITNQQETLMKVNQQLDFLASHDMATGLLNRSAFDIELNNQIKIRQEKGALLMLDIDFFKRVNDQYGHPVGDHLLQKFSELLNNFLNKDALIARWGGEEFIVWIHESDLKNACAFAESLRKHIEETSFSSVRPNLKITVSIGVALIIDQFQSAYERVDQALYKAKESGRNKVCML